MYVSSDNVYQIVDFNAQHLTSVLFSMKGPHQSHIGLAPTTQMTRFTIMYEFVVKISDQIWLRSRHSFNEVKKASFNASLFNDNEFNKFWISWTNGVIEFGTGWVVGEGKLLSHKDVLDMDINYFAVRAVDGITISYDVPEGEYSLSTLYHISLIMILKISSFHYKNCRENNNYGGITNLKSKMSLVQDISLYYTASTTIRHILKA